MKWLLLMMAINNTPEYIGKVQDASAYDEIKSDSAWCGPRTLYFILRLLKVDVTLGDVVSRSKPDSNGYCSLDNLAATSSFYKISNVAVKCRMQTVIAIDKPAILCCSKSFYSDNTNLGTNDFVDSRVHFVAFIKADGDNCWILDTSSEMSARLIPIRTLESYYLGSALFFDLSTIEHIHYIWLPVILWTAVLIAFLVFLSASIRNLYLKRMTKEPVR